MPHFLVVLNVLGNNTALETNLLLTPVWFTWDVEERFTLFLKPMFQSFNRNKFNKPFLMWWEGTRRKEADWLQLEMAVWTGDWDRAAWGGASSLAPEGGISSIHYLHGAVREHHAAVLCLIVVSIWATRTALCPLWWGDGALHPSFFVEEPCSASELMSPFLSDWTWENDCLLKKKRWFLFFVMEMMRFSYRN